MTIEWATPGRASVLVDGQFGSTGKGAAAAWLAARAEGVAVATTAAGAQAGHTTRRRDGSGYVCYHLPTTGVERPEALSYVNSGAIVDLEVLTREIADCGIDRGQVVVSPRAAIITEEHREAERHPDAPTSRISSTQKGVGAALADKIWRRSPLVQGARTPHWLRVQYLTLNDWLAEGSSVVIETPQGFDLSLNHGLAYPFVTSRDCTVTASLEYAGIHPHFLGPVAMVVRTYPIRVGHLRNELGEYIGSSGPFYPDSIELEWARDFPGIEPERTTVTKRVRRISTFSYEQYCRALKMNRPSIVMLTFADYLPSGAALLSMVRRMREIERGVGLEPARTFGFGPCVEDTTDDIDAAAAWYDHRSLG